MPCFIFSSTSQLQETEIASSGIQQTYQDTNLHLFAENGERIPEFALYRDWFQLRLVVRSRLMCAEGRGTCITFECLSNKRNT